MVAAIAVMRSTKATYSSRTPGFRRERNTVTIMAAAPLPSSAPGPSRHGSLGPLGSLGIFRRRFDRLHVGVGEAEMMADLMHQHVLDDGAERFIVLGPIIQDRATIKPNHVRH